VTADASRSDQYVYQRRHAKQAAANQTNGAEEANDAAKETTGEQTVAIDKVAEHAAEELAVRD
jgi:hypothetical protein